MGVRRAHTASGVRDIDGELRDALRRHADLVPVPSPDPMPGVARAARRIRRRRTTSALGSLVLIVGLALGTAVAVHRAQNVQNAHRPGSEQQLAGVFSAQEHAFAAADYLGWPNRGSVPADDLGDAARRAWADRHGVNLPDVVIAPLWSDALPTGDDMFAFQAWDRDERVAWTVFAMRDTDPGGPAATLVSDTPTASGTRTGASAGANTGSATGQVSALVDTSQGPYAIVIGAPGTTDIRYAADGVSFAPEFTRDGVAMFAVPVPPDPPKPAGPPEAARADRSDDARLFGAAKSPEAPLLLSAAKPATPASLLPSAGPSQAPARPTPVASPPWSPPPTVDPIAANPYTAAAGWHAPGVIRVRDVAGAITYQGPIGHYGPPLSAVVGATTSGWLDSSIQQDAQTPLERSRERVERTKIAEQAALAARNAGNP